MTIDEAIDELKILTMPCTEYCGNDETSCEICLSKDKQLCEWLEELKAFRRSAKNSKEWIQYGYNKGIDDLVKEMKKYWNGMTAMKEIIDVAEKMKVGGENER